MFRALYHRLFRQRRPRLRTIRRRWPGYRSLPLRLEVLEPRILLDASNECFLEGVYRDLLNRPLDNQSLAGWSPMLQQGVSRQAVVSQIENSTEYRTDLINQLYNSYLHQPADSVGLANYLSYLQSGGTIEGVEISLLGSAAFFQSQGGGSDAGFLQALYEDVLGRPVDPLAQTVFGSLLQQGLPTAVVATYVVTSTEADVDVVEGSYQTYLHRSADLLGLVVWTSWLEQGAGQENLLAAMLGTEEYFDLQATNCEIEASPPLAPPPSPPLPLCGFDPGLSGWTVLQTGGSATGQGTVTVQNADAVLREGDSLTTSLQKTFTIPNTPSVLQFSYDNLSFDTTAHNQIKDAFEASFVDANGNPLVQTIGTSKDSFFNITEGAAPALAAGVTQASTDEGQTVSLNLAGLAAGTTGTLVLRLVNNDTDTNTSIHITCVELNAAPGEQPVFATPASVANTPKEQINFSALTDVTPSAAIDYGQTSFNNDHTSLFTNLSVANSGSYGMRAPLLAAITQLSDPTVHVENPDGTLPDGTPYFDLSSLVKGGVLDPGQTTGSRQITFLDPNRTPFQYQVKVLSQLNQPPAFTSQPNTEGIPGVPYVYQATAADPDGDPLTFSVLAGPKGLTIDPTSGKVTYSPQAGDLGNHAVTLRVDDGQGGSAEQTYTLDVIQAPPNRPPVFTSTPVVDANVNTPYGYQATATDPDGTKPTDPTGETLTFSVLSSPKGLSIDPASGQVTWQPTADELGTQNVTLQVDDGRGGTATQTYSVLVQQQPGNLPPVIVSTPVTTLSLPAQSTSPGPAPTSGLTLTAAGTAAGFTLSDFIHGFPTIATGNGLGGPGGIFYPSALGGNEVLVNDGADGAVRLFSSDTDGQDAASAKILGQSFGVNNNLAIAEVNGQLYVGEYTAGKVVELNLDGTVGATIANIPNPTGMVVNPKNGHLLVAGQAPGTIFDVDPVAHTATPLITGLGSPDGLTISPDGSTVYVANIGSQQLLGFDTTSGKQVFTSGTISGLDGTALGFGSLSGFIFANTNFGQVWEVPLNDPANAVLIASGGSRGDFISVDPNNGTLLLTQSNEIVRLTPPSGASFNPTALYQYPVVAVDQDKDPLTYSLATAPTGMTIDPNTGLISWDGPPSGSSTTSSPPVDGLTLTGAGTAAGFALSDYAHGFPTIASGGSNVGPLGIVFPNSQDGKRALVSDGAGNLRLLSTDNDNQDAASAQLLANFGSVNAIGLAQVNGQLYMTQQGSSQDVVRLNADGSVAEVIAAIPNATGIVANPANGHLFVSGGGTNARNTVYDVDPIAHTATPFLTGLNVPDGLSLSPDGKTLYVALGGSQDQLVGFDTTTGQRVFTSGTIPGIDGTTVGFGTLSGFVFANTNFGDVWEIPLNNPASPVLIASGGSRGDFISVDPNDGSLLLTQSDEIVRLTPPAGGSFVQDFNVGVRVEDGRGGFDTQNYTLTVAPASQVGEIDGSVFSAAPPQFVTLNATISGRADPYLGGMPNGSTASSGDVAPAESPTIVNGLPLFAGDTLTFNVTGSVSFDGGTPTDPPDGGGFINHFVGDQNGISGVNAPIDSLMGVFLGPDQPSLTSAPTDLDFSSNGNVPGGVNYTSLAPALQQVFFIGDGKTSTGQVQQIVAPAGATRLVLGSMDGQFWADNSGSFSVQVTGQVPPPPLANWPVFLDQNNNGKLDPGEVSTTTDAQGNYHFSNLAPGTYTVAQVVQPGWTQTIPANGPYSVSLVAGQTAGNIDFTNTLAKPTSTLSIVSTPPATATVGQLYSYAPVVLNPTGTPLTFDLPTAPPGMSVDPTSGQIIWVPSADEVGTQTGVLRVRDGKGGVALQDLQINVAPHDTGAVITSTPPEPAVVGVPYQYQVRAQDALGLPLRFTLEQNPVGMTIDPLSGLVTWTPTAGQAPVQHVTIVAADTQGLSAAQSFDLPVSTNVPDTAPTITSTPPSRIGLGQTYLYQVQASDADGDSVSFQLHQAPLGMSINSKGLITWQPTAAQFGDNPVTVFAVDARGTTTAQNFVVSVVSSNVAQPPTITSKPPAAATVGRQYAYDVQATDPQNSPLQFSLVGHPDGMTIDPTTGQLRWTPTVDEVGPQTATVQVEDGLGASATQTFTLTVRGVNVPPVITSEPPTQAAVGQTYSYAVKASDVDGDTLSYALTAAPTGMTIDANTGVITWTPTAGEVGNSTVKLTVDDGQGGSATQTYTVVTAAVPPNQAPSITSTPPFLAAVGQAYQYQVQAADPDGDPVTFALGSAPLGMSIDAKTGLLTWTPTANQAGPTAVEVVASDPSGASGTQDFTLNVQASNQAPVITSTAPLTATAGAIYRYDVQASDPDGDPLTYTLTTGPTGMAIDSLGRLSYSPTTADIGSHPVTITVDDGRGASVNQSFTLLVSADTQAPTVALQDTPNPDDIGSPVTLVVSASDNVGVVSEQLTVNGTPLALDANGRATFTPSKAGLVSIVATATDAAGNVGKATDTLTVIDPTDTSAPTVAITTPTDGQDITGPITVTGTANDKNLLSYTLSVAPLDTGVFTQIGQGTSAVVNGTLGTLDPTLLQNDTYILKLTATNAGGHTASTQVTFGVSQNLKLGNFTLSFNDLTIPVSGIPITLTRTYDTMQASRSEDFGFGWRLDFRDTDLRTSLPLTGLENQDIYTPFQDGARVYLTLPGGQREGFTFEPIEEDLLGLHLFTPNFVPDAGVTDQLTVPGFSLINQQGQYFELNSGLPYNPACPDLGGQYTVTRKDGTVYQIDGNTGKLLTVTDRNHNTLTFSDAGVTSSTGVGITFSRDAQGRIVAMTDPNGKQIQYQYDTQGDLTSATDRDGNVTQYVYRTDFAHYLDHVVDPLGRTGIRTDYNAQGQLDKQIDANGNIVHLTYDPANSLETVTDQLGNATTYEYDGRGNIVGKVDPLGGLTKRTYDANNNLLTETDPLGNTTSYTYDDQNNILTTTDAQGNVTRNTYDQFNDLLTTTDPLGRTVTNKYDSSGNLVQTTDALDLVTTYANNASGVLTSVTAPDGTTTNFVPDNAGNTTKMIQTDNGAPHETDYTYDSNNILLSSTTTVTTTAGVQTLVTSTTYDANNNVLTETAPGNHATSGTPATPTNNVYDADGHLIQSTDPLGRTTKYIYNSLGQLTETDYPDGTSTHSYYDAVGRLIESDDQNSHATLYQYDADGRQIGLYYPTDSPQGNAQIIAADFASATVPHTSNTYDLVGDKIATTDERGFTTHYVYDADNRLVETILPLDSQDNQPNLTPAQLANNPTFTNQYDAAGQLIANTDARGITTRYKYDANGRLIETDYADGTKTSTVYDDVHHTKIDTDQNGVQTEYISDNLGRLIEVINGLGTPNQTSTTYKYDELGRLISQTDANKHTTAYQYDANGNRTTITKPMGQTETSTYDATNRLVSTIDFNGNETTYSYLPNTNYLGTETFLVPNGTGGFKQDGAAYQFTYYPNGLVHTEQIGNSPPTVYVYDNRDRLVSQTNPDGSGISYTYDDASNRTSTTSSIPQPNGTAPVTSTVTYTYDSQNRMKTVVAPDGAITTYSYDLDGNLIETDTVPTPGQSTTLVEKRTYDPNSNRLTSLVNERLVGGAVDATLSSFNYTYDANGNIVEEAEQGGRDVKYTYDKLYRLTQESITDPSAGNRTFQYTYDAVGNRLTENDSVTGQTTYTYDVNDELKTTTNGSNVTSYTYDANGNTLSVAVNGVIQTVYHWDHLNQLVEADVTDGLGKVQVTTFGYDVEGHRISQTTDGQTTNYLIDTSLSNYQAVVEYGANGQVQVSYVFGLALISQHRLSTGAGNPAPIVSYYVYDFHSGVRELANASGAVTDSYAYDAFGNLIAHSGTTVNDHLYRGEVFDTVTGLYDLRTRFLDPATGRFVSADSFPENRSQPSSLNRYEFARNDPVDNVDPMGQEATTLAELSTTFAIIGGIAGAIHGGFTTYLRGGGGQAILLNAVAEGVAGAIGGYLFAQAGGALGLSVATAGAIGTALGVGGAGLATYKYFHATTDADRKVAAFDIVFNGVLAAIGGFGSVAGKGLPVESLGAAVENTEVGSDCAEAARIINNILAKINVDVQILKVQVGTPIRLVQGATGGRAPGGTVVGENGFHFIVRNGGRIHDIVFPYGLPEAKFMSQYEAVFEGAMKPINEILKLAPEVLEPYSKGPIPDSGE